MREVIDLLTPLVWTEENAPSSGRQCPPVNGCFRGQSYLQGTRGQNWFATSSLMAKGLHWDVNSPMVGHSWDSQKIPWLVMPGCKRRPPPRLEVSACLVGGRRISAGLWVCLSESGHSSGWAWIISRGFRDRAMWEHLEWHVNGVRYCCLYVTTLTAVFKRVLRTNKRISWK